MIKHLFKLIWNKKKQNFLLITEMFVSFIVMFAVFTLIVYYYNNYKQPMGFDYDNVWVANYTPPPNIQSNDSAQLFHDVLEKMVKSMPEVVDMSFMSNNVPFSMSTSNTEISYGDHRNVRTNIYTAEDSYKDVLNFKILEGRWFTNADIVKGRDIPIVINKKLKEELFGNETATGKIIGENMIDKSQQSARYRVIGVADNLKDKGSYQAIENGMYRNIDTGAMHWVGNIVLKVKPNVDAAFEGKLFKTLSNAIGTSIEIEHFDKKLVTKNRIMLVPMIILLIVAGFLIINVSLGLFGVLWYNINKRKSEIGLRRAVGASGSSVSNQLVGEALVLATISLILGLFFAVQFPLLNVFDLASNIYLWAIAFSVLFIYVLVIICALYPGKQAAAIYPAVALHEE
ncbi:FtsX-like permease family protein [Panacibacter ginsenosidivorans]|uniref:FtsX-like permease family protein n=1 Tax=Panacibacter ginsenosidivorans TaxID=1813871 RepID=A0A5B8VBP6_9BACT|nr:ABC transporter permease [Panacibacter ginsenosidivorans]QEC68930.1 FtsX-like permease family protein [Panacibacter ginsenosidivorans]